MATAWGGTSGAVTFATGTGLVANVTSWTLTETGDAMDVTTLGVITGAGDDHRVFIAGILEWSGSFDGYVENVGAGAITDQDALETGAATFTTGGGDTFAGDIFITEVERTTGIDSPDTLRCTFQGSSALNKTGV